MSGRKTGWRGRARTHDYAPHALWPSLFLLGIWLCIPAATGRACELDADCDDGVFCNGIETCVNESCQPGTDPCPGQMCSEASAACVECLMDEHCDDDAFCNGPESCNPDGDCEPGLEPCVDFPHCDEAGDSCLACIGDGDCDDANPCTDDTCVANECLFTANEGNSCDDGLYCNGPEECDTNGLCQPGADPCPEQMCREADQACVNCLTGGDCDDNTFCNGAETCDADGNCQPGTAPCFDLPHCDEVDDVCLECLNHTECDDSVPCTDDECVAGACLVTPNDDNCPDDGEFCTGPEICDQELDCVSAGDPCGADEFCNESLDVCDECQVDADCSDGADCSTEACVDGSCVYTAGTELLITEFMAVNRSTIADEDGQYPDWVEIHNPCLPVVNLEGWYLTDSASNLTKWQFPAVSLARGEFLVVFASDKNRATAGSELHTSFKLSGDGEYLALVKPDGVSVAQEYAPQYPQQLVDVSYGLSQTTYELVTQSDTATYHVPTSADAALGATWTDTDFDDSSWATGTLGFGFTNTLAEFDVTYYKANTWVTDLATAEAVISDPAMRSEVVSATAASINYLNTGGSAHYGGDEPFPGTTIGENVDDFVVLVSGTIVIPEAGDWTFGVNSDDGFGLELFRDPYVFSAAYPGTRNPGDTLAVFDIPEAGSYLLRLVFFERGGGAEVELFAAPGTHGSFSDSAFNLVGDVPSGGLAVLGFGSEVGTDVQDSMLQANASLWTRVAFDVDDSGPLAFLTMSLKYEDGFVAYLNGQQVAAGNSPLTVGWDASAASDRPLQDAADVEQVDVTAALPILQPGPNVLAVQGLNDHAADGDFLILPELQAVEDTTEAAPERYFVATTPRHRNGTGYPGVSGSVEFSAASGTFTDDFLLTLNATGPGATIRYTLDGSDPSESNGAEYSEPLTITTTTQVRARAFETDLAPGRVGRRLYSVLNADVLEFNSNLPLVIIDSFGHSIGQHWQTLVVASFIDTTDGRTNITDPPDFVGPGGLQMRGSSSLGFPKKQYAFETWDEEDDDLDVAILGMPQESDWILYAPYSDKSLMRNVLAYKWSNDLGRYAVRTRFVELFLDMNGGGISDASYVGVYVLMEKIKRGPHRVDITELTPLDDAEPEVTGGYMVKKDRLDPGDSGFQTSIGQLLAFVEPKEVEITGPQETFLSNFFNEFESALNGPDFADPLSGYASYIDADSFIDHHILVEVTKNIDGFRLSTFMFKDREGPLNMGPIWDYNLCLGNANYMDGWLPDGWYNILLGESNYPWWRRLFQDDEFGLRYADRWFELRRDQFQTDRMLADIDDLAALLDESQVRNFDRWPILGVYVWPNWFIAETYAEEIDWMKQWLTERLDWIDAQFLAPPVFSQQGGEVPYGFELTISADSGLVYYTMDGSDPRLPGGDIAAEALAYSAPVPITDNTLVRARILDNGEWGALNQATFAIETIALVINELMANNVSTIEDPDEPGEFPPWIELYNNSDTTIDLGGVFLTDDPGDPAKWPIPDETELCGGQRLVVWADAEPVDGPLHASFSLSSGSGLVEAYEEHGILIDSVAYGPLEADISFGRMPDAGTDVLPLVIPTPGAPNEVPTTSVILNEYNAVASDELLGNNGSDVFWGRVLGNGGDWFEFVVVTNHLDMRGWQLVLSNDTGSVDEEIQVLTLSEDAIWSDLRAGTIVTVAQDLADDVSYDPLNGDWWINVQASAVAAGTYITNSDFVVTNRKWQLTIADDTGAVVYGPAGEGVNPTSGVGSDEVFKLEEEASPTTAPFSNYNDGTSSTFGAPNVWSAGSVTQDFAALRSALVTCGGDEDCDTGQPCIQEACIGGECYYETIEPCFELGFNVLASGAELCPDGLIQVSLGLSGAVEPVSGVQVLLAYDTGLWSLNNITPGDGGGSPWDVALVDTFADSSGEVQYALQLPGGSLADATVATLEFLLLGTEGETSVRFGPPCPPLRTELTAEGYSSTILPTETDSETVAIVECSDANPCTLDACTNGTCQYINLTDGASCDDGTFCNGEDTCQGGTCVAGSAPCPGLCELCDEDQQVCHPCRFDLWVDEDGTIGAGDFSVFAPCYGQCYAPGDPCLASNFDDDGGGCVGAGDFSWFSPCYDGTCDTCDNCFGPLGGRSLREEATATASVQLVAVASPTLMDVMPELPPSDRSLTAGEPFYLEMWASGGRLVEGGEDGLAAVYADLIFDSSRLIVDEMLPSVLFDLLHNGVLIPDGGVVEALGGCAPLGVGSLGVDSTWVRIATLSVRVKPSSSATLAPSDSVLVETGPSAGAYQIAIFNSGALDVSDIEFGSVRVSLSRQVIKLAPDAQRR